MLHLRAQFTFFLQVGKECVEEPLPLLVIREAVLVEHGLCGVGRKAIRDGEMMVALFANTNESTSIQSYISPTVYSCMYTLYWQLGLTHVLA